MSVDKLSLDYGVYFRQRVSYGRIVLTCVTGADNSPAIGLCVTQGVFPYCYDKPSLTVADYR